MKDRIENFLKDLILQSLENYNRLAAIEDEEIMSKPYVRPIFVMIMKSYKFQESNLRIVLNRYISSKERKV